MAESSGWRVRVFLSNEDTTEHPTLGVKGLGTKRAEIVGEWGDVIALLRETEAQAHEDDTALVWRRTGGIESRPSEWRFSPRWGWHRPPGDTPDDIYEHVCAQLGETEGLLSWN